jgi:phage-related tail fiber protein
VSFATIHTNAGLALIAQAQATGTPINLTHMAVGDGNGNAIEPIPMQTALVREVYRAMVNRVFKPDPTNQPLRFSAELLVPASVGGFTMREVGIYTDDGTLFAVGNLPPTYKPEAGEGAFADTSVRLDFLVENADVITLQIDPNVALVTQQWVTNNITAATIIPGGTTQQVLRKVSNADGDYEWSDPTDANVFVSTVEETQTLAGGQTVVTLAVVNTAGLAVYIEGVRLPVGSGVDQWEPDPTDVTRLTLGQAYPAGTKILAVQNEPAGSLPEALRRDQNLADVPNAATARGNLGVPSITDLRNAVPAGAIIYLARDTAPSGWLKANGAAVSRSVYSDLFNAIGTTFGAGNGSTTFNLPDLRGEFLRGWDDGRGVDAGRGFASGQAYATAAPQTTTPQGLRRDGSTHALMNAANPSRVGFMRVGNPGEVVTPSGHDSTVRSGHPGSEPDVLQSVTGDAETRPRNIALLACIKF